MLMLIVAGLACSTNPLSIDDDGDGYSEFEGDCDDSDPQSTIRSQDEDCDGTLTADDCDDTDASSSTREGDFDCDGIITPPPRTPKSPC